MAKLDRWVEQAPGRTRRGRGWRRLIPGIGAFFTPLDLTGEKRREKKKRKVFFFANRVF